jgi:hypothetical protein
MSVGIRRTLRPAYENISPVTVLKRPSFESVNLWGNSFAQIAGMTEEPKKSLVLGIGNLLLRRPATPRLTAWLWRFVEYRLKLANKKKGS